MHGYGLFQTLWLSFYSGELYAEVAQSWRNRVFTYLAIVLAINQLPDSLDMVERVDAWVTGEAPHLIAQIPPIAIADGRASMEGDGPVYVKDRSDSLFLIIDMTGRHTALVGTGATALLTGTHFSIRNGPSDEDIQTQAIPPDENTTITQEMLQSLVWLINGLVGYGFYPAAVAVTGLFYLLQAFLLAVFVTRFSPAIRERFSRRSLTGLAIVAFTPSLLLDTIHDLMETPLELWIWWPMSMFLAIGYFFFAVEAAADQENMPEENNAHGQ
ncbi:MAG: DUF1189 family protein [candidate division Zixibacteria bacterium]|nr:DUF1189 family protein [candidate division Zixibacteria bacterium]